MLGSRSPFSGATFGVFASEFLILTTAMSLQPWATPILLVALGVAFAAVFSKSSRWCSARPRRSACPPAGADPVFAHLAIVLAFGLYIPPYLVDWYHEAAKLIG